LTMADRIVVMNHGVIEQVGTPTEIYREPDTLFVADFIGEMNKIPGKATGSDDVVVGGSTLATRPYSSKPDESVIVTIRPEDIVPHGKQGIGLKHDAEIPLRWRQGRNIISSLFNCSCGLDIQPRDGTKKCCFSAPRWAQKAHKLTFVYIE